MIDAVAHVAIHDFARGGDRRVVHAFACEHAFARLHDDANVLDVGDLVPFAPNATTASRRPTTSTTSSSCNARSGVGSSF